MRHDLELPCRVLLVSLFCLTLQEVLLADLKQRGFVEWDRIRLLSRWAARLVPLNLG